MDIFETININFLVVGHTHDSLDQTFSVISKALGKIYQLNSFHIADINMHSIAGKCDFIGSPLAVREIYQTAHREECHRPKFIEQLHFLYDWKAYFKNVVNKDIHYYQLPHRFRVRLTFNLFFLLINCGICVDNQGGWGCCDEIYALHPIIR